MPYTREIQESCIRLKDQIDARKVSTRSILSDLSKATVKYVVLRRIYNDTLEFAKNKNEHWLQYQRTCLALNAQKQFLFFALDTEFQLLRKMHGTMKGLVQEVCQRQLRFLESVGRMDDSPRLSSRQQDSVRLLGDVLNCYRGTGGGVNDVAKDLATTLNSLEEKMAELSILQSSWIKNMKSSQDSAVKAVYSNSITNDFMILPKVRLSI